MFTILADPLILDSSTPEFLTFKQLFETQASVKENLIKY
jgi:hypothetical protein